MLDDPAYSSIAKAIEEGVFKKELASLSCTVCKASIQFICAESHLQGARHKKAVKNLLLQEASKPGASCDTSGSSGTGLLAAITKGQVVSQNIGNGVLLTCVPCCVSYREEIPMIQHLGSEVHARNVKVPSNTSTPSSRLTVQSNGVSSTDMPAVQDVFEAIRSGIVLQATGTSGLVTLTCSLCQKECNGDATMRQHLTSSAHAKQLKMKEQRLSFPPAREPSVATVTPSTTRQFDSASPATTSPVQGNGMAQAVTNPADPDENPFYCSVCEISCTGKESMDQHLKGKSHMKKLKMKEQRLSFSPAREPSVPTVTPSTTRQIDSASSATTSTVQGWNGVGQARDKIIVIPPEPDENYLFCRVCNIPCTGKESMEQHLKGKNHMKKFKTEEERLSLSPAREPSVATVTPSTTRQSDSASPATTSTVLGNGVDQPMDKTIEVAAETDAYSLKCSLCGITCTGMEQLMYHKKGKSHMKKLKEVDYGVLRDNSEDSPRSPIRIDYIQHEQSIRELTKDIRIYKPDQSLSDMFDEILAG
ncbi:zinc finger RNA-binding protein-like isoform X3 [Eriocheir sinensis]|nr:zinc finger RNA-binding protein-like isoform X3 [Eriocheir sinensis]XP_050703087.1 zinc finger RNA-binding protein-like isoform X3 [Eriocheir sinensis]XP_050703088.1 zinc finger RNA-binding protein-like isoform X3 [Eriocheir sinensis]XP_050703089.1 zinc finger RNA-binding protein-like isoform X3 [Eriocheir sinensis]XP_050703090.1 zinc finger RNA-binding protein-like isoform X3 [Eriocheir sinensis]XP_050703091.1 zinc finger RNA-binding protein-like isoform X3 [Eriocheir sinensis]